MRPQAFGESNHFVGAGNLEVEDGRDELGDGVDVGVLHMTPVFAEMRSNAVRAGGFAERYRFSRNRFVASARLPNGRDMIDVDVQALTRNHGALLSRRRRVRKIVLLGLVSLTAACHSS